MKIGRMVFAAMFAIGLGSSCACAQTATFTAEVAQVNLSAGTISLTQTLPAKPTAVGTASADSPTATADYKASPVLLNNAPVGTTVQATVQLVNGYPAVTALQTPNGAFFGIPQVTSDATASLAPTISSVASNPAVSNPARLTPAGIQ